ncbi:MAG TPA: WG repeat-containing protein [Ignavibacteriaceae bacterium]|nr:WG repeat-containing protein [Ignavibacteriaceae bacterium]
MKTIILTYILLLCGTFSYSQQNNYWTAFWDEDGEKFGFKDNSGLIVIQPKFSGFSFVIRLEHIFIASEELDDKLDIYYLTKSGRQFGRDSIYLFDNTPDCESETFIRFKDKKAEKVGLFNRNGEVVIPAIYNDMTEVNNGLVIALKDAEKKYWEEHQHSDCNHFSWIGGQTMLIDTNNRVIIENFTDSLILDFYSHQLQDKSDDASNREYFSGVDGKIHSFINYEKDFSIWLKHSLLDNFTTQNLVRVCYGRLTFWKDEEGWVSASATKIIEKNFMLIKDRLSVIQNPEQDFFVSIDGLNSGIFQDEEFKIYFNNCGQPLTGKYPVMNVVITRKNAEDFYQDHFDFLKTDGGYKLISLTIRNGIIEE